MTGAMIREELAEAAAGEIRRLDRAAALLADPGAPCFDDRYDAAADAGYSHQAAIAYATLRSEE